MLKEINFEPAMFREWLNKSRPRPVLLVGRRNGVAYTESGMCIDEEWCNYSVHVLVLAGFWDPGKYGAYAYLGVTHHWYEENMYCVPSELYIEERDLYPERSCQNTKCHPADAIRDAAAGKNVEKRYAWVDDADSVLRIACRAVVFELAKKDYEIGMIRLAADKKYRLVDETAYGIIRDMVEGTIAPPPVG